MIGPTGVGKTEVARRMAILADAPFIKVEATKFTEVGFRGADVDQIIKDLVEISINLNREREFKKMEKIVTERVEENILDLLLGKSPDKMTDNDEFMRSEFRRTLRDKQLDQVLLDYEPKATPQIPSKASGKAGVGILGLPLNLQQLMSKMDGGRKKGTRKMTIKEIRPMEEQAVRASLIREDLIVAKAIRDAEEYGIVFIDEIDKIVGNSSRYHADASDEGVQRDLLPIIEGTKITTDHGDVDTSKMLFIAAGAFHHSKPSDLLAELQGRLPIRVQLEPLNAEHLYRILTEPEPNLIRQQIALIKTEDVELEFTEAAIRRIANIASEVNEQVENIGARRLYTIMEKVLEELSFNAGKYKGQKMTIDVAQVDEHMKAFTKRADLKQYIL
jgi:ATP-dependent HslUV protease ATP-binding subunit HslU